MNPNARYVSHGRHQRPTLSSGEEVKQPAVIRRTLYELFRSYGFFLVRERLDESIVAFANLLGVNIRDVVMPSSAKIRALNNGLWEYNWRSKKCTKRPIYPKPPAEFLEYLASPSYKMTTYADQLLYLAANHSLDLTIKHTIGLARFEQDLVEFQRLKEKVLDYCGQRLGNGCDSNGTVIKPLAKCYLQDFGCGYGCVDEFMEMEGRTVGGS